MVETKLNKEYALRLFGIGALCFGITAWSLWDGRVSWPKANDAMEKVRPAMLAKNLSAEQWLAVGTNGVSELESVFAAIGEKAPAKLVRKIGELRLPERATENREELRAALARRLGETIGNPVYSGHDLGGQFVQAFLTAVFGLLALAAPLSKLRKKFIADENGLRGSGFNGELDYSDIQSVDWRQWKKKGIAILRTKKGNFKLDAWYYAGMKDIVAEITKVRPELKADA